MRSTDDIVLSLDRRGMREAYAARYPGSSARAARALTKASGAIAIATGFYIRDTRTIEPDGPPGAAALGRAAMALGRRVYYFTDTYAVSVLQQWGGLEGDIIGFDLGLGLWSDSAVRDVLVKRDIACVVAVERCGHAADGQYYNMRGEDITMQTAELDVFFRDDSIVSIGIGDGGNEIGVGPVVGDNIALPQHARSVVKVGFPVLAATSNWGAYAVVAELGKLSGRSLLPNAKLVEEELESLWGLGVVDGLSANGRGVDGYTMEQNLGVLEELRCAEMVE